MTTNTHMQAKAHALSRDPAMATPDAVHADWTSILLQTGVVTGLLVILYWHVLDGLLYKWSNIGDWSHGFLIPLFSLYYLHIQRDRFPHGMQRAGYFGLVVLLLGFGLYLYGVLWTIGYVKDVSLVVSIFGAIYLMCGWPTARWAWFAVAFLMFALPLPYHLYEQITLPLQRIASTVSAGLLNLLPGMDAQAENIVISYFYKGRAGDLNVEQACSGIRLMMAFVALGVAMAFASERPLWHQMVMILACVPIAIFCNVVRVTTTGLFVVFDQAELARGTYHSMLGLSMLIIAFALFGLISYVLSHLFVDVPADEADERESPVAPVE